MKNPVAYQNKDIISKVFGESMRNKSFRAYGMDIPEIVEILSTNLPAVEANEMRLDNLFRLKDGTIVIVDYTYPEYRGYVYAKILMETLFRLIDDNNDFYECIAINNFASIRAAEKIGLKKDGFVKKK